MSFTTRVMNTPHNAREQALALDEVDSSLTTVGNQNCIERL
jgi:hypothetical protein